MLRAAARPGGGARGVRRSGGSVLRLVLRGTPGYGQPEVELDARIMGRLQSEFGRTVRADFGTVSIALTERPPLPIHPKFWSRLGLSARDADVIVQKNFFHYRMFYATTSFRHVPVVSDGATSLTRVRAREYLVPTYPGADVADWRASDPVLRAPGARSAGVGLGA
ncbi:MAG: MlrC C-terminal domain-containing protein [Sandaracinaceae bacterium]|nr:MlrC C-terminal domain-containing protein [Sandaracinaceae bacterium]